MLSDKLLILKGELLKRGMLLEESSDTSTDMQSNCLNIVSDNVGIKISESGDISNTLSIVNMTDNYEVTSKGIKDTLEYINLLIAYN